MQFQSHVMPVSARRDDARKVLASILLELGPRYLEFMMDVLESALPEKGYLAHVRAYTVHFIMEIMLTKVYRIFLVFLSGFQGWSR